MLCRVAAVKSLPRTSSYDVMQVIFYFLWDHWANPACFENRIPVKPELGGGGGKGGRGAYAASQTIVLHMKRLNHTVSDYRDFVCSLFPRAILSDFCFLVKFDLHFFGIIKSKFYLFKVENLRYVFKYMDLCKKYPWWKLFTRTTADFSKRFQFSWYVWVKW